MPGRMWLMVESGSWSVLAASEGSFITVAGSGRLTNSHWCVTKFSLNGMVYWVTVGWSRSCLGYVVELNEYVQTCLHLYKNSSIGTVHMLGGVTLIDHNWLVIDYSHVIVNPYFWSIITDWSLTRVTWLSTPIAIYYGGMVVFISLPYTFNKLISPRFQ